MSAANVLLTANGDVKLADFGVSGQLTATMTKKVGRACELADGRTHSSGRRTGCRRKSSSSRGMTTRRIYGVWVSGILWHR